MTSISGQTPVIIGAAQFTERSDDPGYETLSPVAITARAAQLALADAGLATAVRRMVSVVVAAQMDDQRPSTKQVAGESRREDCLKA